MESSRGQNGIQLLLAAEQEAQHIVNAARTEKLARLKQAKDEAAKEIADFRAQMEAEFQRKLEETSGDSGANVKRLEQETGAKIEQLKSQTADISQEVVSDAIEVCDICNEVNYLLALGLFVLPLDARSKLVLTNLDF